MSGRTPVEYVPITAIGNMGLPSEAPAPSSASVGESALCAYLLARMMEDYLVYRSKSNLTTEERLNGVHARMWLWEEHEYADCDNGIEHVCSVLGADPDWVRRKVSEMEKLDRRIDMHAFGRAVSLVVSGAYSDEPEGSENPTV